MERNLYRVCDGEAVECDETVEWDGRESVLVLAANHDQAQRVAAKYDLGLRGRDNCMWRGVLIVAVKAEEGD